MAFKERLDELNFRMVGYHTEYSCKGSVELPMEERACFAQTFYNHDLDTVLDNTYVIKIYKWNRVERLDNCCMLNKKELKSHIDSVKHIPETCSCKIVDKTNCYEVHLHIKDVGYVHKWVLTYIRYCYEYPYNIFLMEAFRFHTENCAKGISLPNIFNVVATTFSSICDWNSGHSIIYRPDKNVVYPMFKQKDIRKHIDSAFIKSRYGALNNTYEQINLKNQSTLKYPTSDQIDDVRKVVNILSHRELLDDCYKHNLKMFKSVKN